MQMVKMAVMPLQEAKSFQDQLKSKGIEIKLDHNEQTCTRGCTVTVEVHGQEKDLPVIAQVYQENYAKLLEGHEVNFEVMNSVYDPNQEQATCPACGTDFSTKLTECPECGLVLG
jgi:hypothetical protein